MSPLLSFAIIHYFHSFSKILMAIHCELDIVLGSWGPMILNIEAFRILPQNIIDQN